MSGFLIVAALLVAAVLAVLLWPLLRSRGGAPVLDDSAASNLRIARAQLHELDAERADGTLDADQYAASRAELERRTLDEAAAKASPTRAAGAGRRSAIALALAVPLLAAALYAHLGNRGGLDPAQVAGSAEPQEVGPEEMQAAVAALAERLRAEPENPDGWALLGRSYIQLQRFDAARDAFAQAVRRRGDDPQLLADYADAWAMAQGRNLQGEPEQLLARALALDPNHAKSLALAGTAALARKDYDTALAHWTRLREQVPADSPLAQGLDAAINEARAGKGLPPLAGGAGGAAGADAPAAAAALAGGQGAASASAATAPATSGASLRVHVTLAPALAGRVQRGDTLFVFARAASGARMPLAIVRQPLDGAPAAPITVELDDAQAMAPQFRLSGADRVVVVARISRAGSATPMSGDLEAESAPMAPAGEVSLAIERVRP